MLFKSLKTMLLAISAAVATAMAPVATAADTPVRIGSSVRSIFSLPLYVADQKGYFKEQGLDVSISFFRGGPPATAALLGGSVDLIAASLENQLKVNQRGERIQSVLTLQSDFSGALAVHETWTAKHGPAKSVSDLEHARIGTLSRGGYADMALRFILRDAGLDPDKHATLIPLNGYDKALPAAQAGELDAVLFVEPWQTIAVEGTGGWQYVIDITAGQGPELFQDMGYVTLQSSGAYLDKNEATVGKIVSAVVKAQSYIRRQENLDDLVAIAHKVFPSTDTATLRSSIGKQQHTFRPDLKETMIAKNTELLRANGAIELPAPGAPDVFDQRFLSAAANH